VWWDKGESRRRQLLITGRNSGSGAHLRCLPVPPLRVVPLPREGRAALPPARAAKRNLSNPHPEAPKPNSYALLWHQMPHRMPHCSGPRFSSSLLPKNCRCRKKWCIVKTLHNSSPEQSHSVLLLLLSHTYFARPTIPSTPHPGLTWKSTWRYLEAVSIQQGFFSCWWKNLGLCRCLAQSHRARDLTDTKAAGASLPLLGFLLELGSGVHQSSLKEVTLKPPLTLM